jgi:zinc protease
LAEGQTFFADPLHYQADLRATEAVAPADVQRVAEQYLTAGRLVLSMVPAGKLDLVSKPSLSYENATTTRDSAAKGAR